MEESVYMDKVPVHTVYDPVRYRRPGKLQPELEPVFFLPVQGQLSILRPQSHSIRCKEPPIPNGRATYIQGTIRC